MDSRAKFTQSSPRSLCLIKFMTILGPNHWSLDNHRLSLPSIDSNMLQWFMQEMEKKKKKTQGMLTGSLTLTRKIPCEKLITFLKLWKPKRPEGPQHITLDSKRPVSSHILEQAGWGADRVLWRCVIYLRPNLLLSSNSDWVISDYRSTHK